MDLLKKRELSADKLRWTCDPESLGFETTEDVGAVEEKVIAQERAVSALKFGMGMKGSDYNIFVAGDSRAGLTYLTRQFLLKSANHEETPKDWCYVFNFKDPDRPKAISLEKGKANELAQEMDELVEDLKFQIPEIFESEEYRQRRDGLFKEFTGQRNKLIAELEEKVKAEGFILNMSQEGMMIVPSVEERPMTEQDLNALDEDQKTELRKKSEALQELMNQTVQEIRTMERGIKKKHKELDQRMALARTGHLIEELQTKYKESKQVITYLLEVKKDIINNLNDFKPGEQQPAMPFPMPMQKQEADFTRYKINVFIDNTEQEGAPVIYETNPTYTNLLGTMERKASFGALFTDFTMIRPGSIHRANGGYLVIQARDLLKYYPAWEGLIRALKNKEIVIEDINEMYGMISTKGMKPEPIPLKIKVLLIGDPYIYHLLHTHEERFQKLFKVKVHLDDEVKRHEEEVKNYVSFTARMVQTRDLLHVNKTGVARLLEYGAEISGRQNKLTLKMSMIRDVIREADYWARDDGEETIGREQVDKAIRQKKKRSSLTEEKIREHIIEGYKNVATSGGVVGQINGLSVYDLGDYAFGGPSRISAAVSLGRQGVVAIDREAKMAGSIHNKGILIMEGYLRDRYAEEKPLSLNASLVFEQSYGMVDGDSASVAELVVLLSRVAGVPVKQNIAITGAISQKGEAQPIGGVNQKVEGFFEVCRERGLTGDQGVVIPKANVPDLMLKGQVIDAAKEGNFHIYAVETADQAIEILTGLPAGERGDDGTFPEGSFNRKVDDRLTELNEIAQKMMKNGDGEGKDSGGDSGGGCEGCH